jgi:hypothetical protein
MIITKIRFWTRHTYKVRRYMMICTCIRKPSNRSSGKDIIKCEINISLNRMSSQLRTLLGSMPIFITQLTLYVAIITTKTISLMPKTSCYPWGRTKGEPVPMLARSLTRSITMSVEVLSWAIVRIIVAMIGMSPAPTKTTNLSVLKSEWCCTKNAIGYYVGVGNRGAVTDGWREVLWRHSYVRRLLWRSV